MLTRIHIKGYKSLADVEVKLRPLSVLFGPNAAGKSNFLDALQLLSKMATSKTLKDAFAPPYRGKPLESFHMTTTSCSGVRHRRRLRFSIEADFRLSDAIVKAVNRQIREMRQPGGERQGRKTGHRSAQVRERDLRYRVGIEMLPQSGFLRVTDEYLAALNSRGEPTGARKPFIERKGQRLHLRMERQSHPFYHELLLDHTLLSLPHYPPHYPHLVAARRELENWLFFYFEPREHMRAPGPVREVRHIGLMGEELAAYLNTLKVTQSRQFEAIERALQMLIPGMEGIEVDVSDLGEVELRLRENGVAIPARVLSEGTLRMLGLLALAAGGDASALVGFEEPENGVHPGRIRLIAELLNTQKTLGQTQYIVTTHSPILPDLTPDESLFAVRKVERQTRIDPFSTWGTLARRAGIDEALDESRQHPLRVSERILRGDFGA